MHYSMERMHKAIIDNGVRLRLSDMPIVMSLLAKSGRDYSDSEFPVAFLEAAASYEENEIKPMRLAYAAAQWDGRTERRKN